MGISRRDHIRNKTVRSRTRVADIAERIAHIKWNCVAHVARQSKDRWAQKIIFHRPRKTKRSRGRPQKHWLGDVKKVVGSVRHHKAQNRSIQKILREAYVQEWLETS